MFLVDDLKRRLGLPVLLLLLLLAGCKSSEPAVPYQIADAPAGYTPISDSLSADAEMEALIAPYRLRLEDAISEVIGQAEVQLQKGGLESTLGNMSAEAMLQVANRIASQPVDMALTNNGGLRVPIQKGPITVGKVFELMPFENMMVVLELTAAQVDTLARQLAAAGGEPIAGFAFSFDEETRVPAEIQVAGAPLDPARTYRLVTSDYLADGGGRIGVIWDPVAREDLNMLLRDAFIEYIRTTGSINPVLDGRIRHTRP